MKRARRLWAPLAAALLAFPAAAAAVQPQAPERDCQDDRGVDRCAPAEHRRMLDLFGLLPVEDHVEAGSQLRRVMYVDGYGRDIVAIVFIRPREADPVLRVHFPRREDGTRIDPLEAPVPPQVWEDILFRSDKFDRELAGSFDPLPDGMIRICGHSWVYAVESVDPPAREREAVVRRKTESACADGLAATFAWEAEAAAIALLPHCNLLEPDLHRNHADRLAACAMLSGDRQAAALVHNVVSELQMERSPAEMARRFDFHVILDWQGETVSGRGTATAWTSRFVQDEAINFFATTVHGESAERVRVHGFLQRYVPGADDGATPWPTAAISMVWKRRGGEDFVIESIRVGPFLPMPAPGHH